MTLQVSLVSFDRWKEYERSLSIDNLSFPIVFDFLQSKFSV
jgi:hypothetical protein